MSGQTRRAQAPTGDPEGSMFTLEMRTARVAEAAQVLVRHAIPLHRALLLRRLGQQPHRHLRGVACTHRVHFFRPASPASPSSLESPSSEPESDPASVPARKSSSARCRRRVAQRGHLQRRLSVEVGAIGARFPLEERA